MDSKTILQTDEQQNFISSIAFITSRWRALIVIVVLFMTLAFLYTKYTAPKYLIGTSMMINDSGSSTELAGFEDLLGSSGILGQQANIQNEIKLISSYSLITQSLKQTDFGYSIYLDGKILDKELYGTNLPFLINIDSTHSQLIDCKVRIQLLEEDRLLLAYKQEEASVYLPGEDKVLRSKIQNIDTSFSVQMNDWIDTEYFRFRLIENPFFEPVIMPNTEEHKDYYVVFKSIGQLTQEYKDKLSVRVSDLQSTVLDLFVEGESVEKEAFFLNTLCNTYLKATLDEKNLSTANTLRFIDQQLDKVTDSLNYSETMLTAFRESGKILNVEASTLQLMNDISGMEGKIAELSINDNVYNYLLEKISTETDYSNMHVPSSNYMDNQALNQLIQKLQQLYAQKIALKEYITNDNKQSLNFDRQIQFTKNNLKEYLLNSIKTNNILLKGIKSQLAKKEASLLRLPQNEQSLLQIERKFNLNSQLFSYLQEKKAELGIIQASNTPVHKIIDTARMIGSKPISPKKAIILIVSITFSFAFFIIYCFVFDSLNNKIQDAEELSRYTNISILGIIPESVNRQNIFDRPKSGFSESFREMRANLQFITKGNPSVIGLTSTISGEGKTFCGFNMGAILSLGGQRVIIVGADLRKPKLHLELQVEEGPGLSNYLSREDVPLESVISNYKECLDYILSGPNPPNPAELLNSDKMRAMIQTLKQQYDYVIIDAPAVGLVADYRILQSEADITFFVLRKNYSEKRFLKELDDLIDKQDMKNVYILLNGMKKKNAKSYGYYEEEDIKVFSKKWFKEIINP